MIVQPRQRFHGRECSNPAENLTTVVPRHSDRGNLPGPLVQIKVRSAADVHASFGEVHRAASIVGELREEFLLHPDYLMGLTTCAGDLSSYDDILTLPKHSAEGITGKRPAMGLPPSHNHSGVQTA